MVCNQVLKRRHRARIKEQETVNQLLLQSVECLSEQLSPVKQDRRDHASFAEHVLLKLHGELDTLRIDKRTLEADKALLEEKLHSSVEHNEQLVSRPDVAKYDDAQVVQPDGEFTMEAREDLLRAGRVQQAALMDRVTAAEHTAAARTTDLKECKRSLLGKIQILQDAAESHAKSHAAESHAKSHTEEQCAVAATAIQSLCERQERSWVAKVSKMELRVASQAYQINTLQAYHTHHCSAVCLNSRFQDLFLSR